MKDAFRTVFKGGIFGGGHWNSPDPYLSSTTILVDTVKHIVTTIPLQLHTHTCFLAVKYPQ